MPELPSIGKYGSPIPVTEGWLASPAGSAAGPTQPVSRGVIRAVAAVAASTTPGIRPTSVTLGVRPAGDQHDGATIRRAGHSTSTPSLAIVGASTVTVSG